MVVVSTLGLVVCCFLFGCRSKGLTTTFEFLVFFSSPFFSSVYANRQFACPKKNTWVKGGACRFEEKTVNQTHWS